MVAPTEGLFGEGGGLTEPMLIAISIVAALLGIGIAYALYGPQRDLSSGRLAEPIRGPLAELLERKFFVDEAYEAVFVRFGGWVANGLAWFDKRGIDGLVNGAGQPGLGQLTGRATRPDRVGPRLRGRVRPRRRGAGRRRPGAGGVSMDNLVMITVLLPILGAVLIGLLAEDDRLARWIALGASLATLAAAVVMAVQFDPAGAVFQFAATYEWIPAIGANIGFGVDGIALVLIVLTAFITPLIVISSWHVTDRVKGYMAAFLVLEGAVIGVFTATDLLLFYVFFEFTLDPDVPDHRHVGWRQPPLRRREVLPLHLLRRPADAGGHPVAVRRGRWPVLQLRRDRPGVARPRPAAVAVRRLLRGLRREGAAVPGPHLAARRPHRGADGRRRCSWPRSC